jgi:hypothetical protein
MKNTGTRVAFVLIVAFFTQLAAAPSAGRDASKTATFTDSLRAALEARTAKIFKRSCATSGCHGGSYPKARLSLEPANMTEAVADVRSRQVDTLMLVDTREPGRSYLLMKIRGDEGIKGELMPIDMPRLKTSEVETIELWAASLEARKEEPPAPPGKKKP